MELQQLRYVAAVARERHFGKAAERSYVTQPTLSQQIMKLEKELGVSLFERSARGVTLTPEGERFVPRVLAILEELEGALHATKEETGAISGRVRLAAIPTIGAYLLPRILKAVRKKAPELALELHDLTTSMLLENLKQGRIDMGILALPVEDPALLTRSFGTEEFFLAVRRGHPLASKRRASMSRIREERMLILQEGHCFRDQALEYCAMSSKDERIVFQGSSLTSVMRLTAAGEGVTFVPRMAADARENPGLSFVRCEAPEPKREIGVVWRATTPLSKAHLFLMEAIEAAFKP